jgi:hypothetical protein
VRILITEFVEGVGLMSIVVDDDGNVVGTNVYSEDSFPIPEVG